MGVIYFIEVFEVNAVKIGYADSQANALDRLALFQIGCPLELELLGTIEGTRKAERAMHSRFKQARINGEWFSREGALAEYMADLNLPKRNDAAGYRFYRKSPPTVRLAKPSSRKFWQVRYTDPTNGREVRLSTHCVSKPAARRKQANLQAKLVREFEGDGDCELGTLSGYTSEA